MNVAVIGHGVVGRHMAADIERAGHEAVISDLRVLDGVRGAVIPRWIGGPDDGAFDFSDVHARINECDAAFICVGTPQAKDGSCDLSAIEDVFSWLRVPIVIIRSTVPPGTTWGLQARYNGAVCFSPEFIGEGVNAPYSAMRQPPFLIIGGNQDARTAAAVLLSRLYNSECEFVFLDAVTAEVAKYYENAFLATKVTLNNEFHNICQKFGADYNAMINAVAHDYRIGRSHLHVYPDKRGFDGRCLPKDLSAILTAVGRENAPFLDALERINEYYKTNSDLYLGR